MHLHSNRDVNTAEIETIYGGNQDWLLCLVQLLKAINLDEAAENGKL